jgi:hypothetical protein
MKTLNLKPWAQPLNPQTPLFRMKTKLILPILALLVTLLGAVTASASTYYSVASGNWNAASTWATSDQGSPGAGPPVAGDTVNITRDFTVTLNVNNAACATLNLGKNTGSSAHSGTLTFASSGSPALTVSGTVTLGGASSTASAGIITMTSGATLSAGSFAVVTATGNTWTPGTGTVVLTANNTLPSTIFTSFNNLTINGGATTTAVGLTVGGNLVVGNGATFYASGYALTVTGTTTVGGGTSGILNITSATGAKLFTGLITINAGGTWNNSGNSPVEVQGGITLASTGTFSTAGSAVYTFDTNPQTLTGTFSIQSVTVNGVTLNNSGTLTVGTALAGTGGLTQGANATLNIGGTSTIATLTATAAGNTVNYTGTAQTVLATAYTNLVFSGSGAKSMATGTSVAGNLSIVASGPTASVGNGLSLNVGSLTLGGTAQAVGTYGGTTSPAGTINTTYFAATTGIVSVGSPQLIVTLPGQTFNSGSGNSGTVTAQTAGTAFNITLTAVDGSNNKLAGYTGSKTVSYTGPANAPGGGTPTYTTTVTFTSGQATSVATTLVDAQATTITASVSGLAGVASSSLTVNPSTANKLVMKTEPSSSVTAGGTFSTQPAVYVEDANGNVVTTDGSTVTATVGTGTGPLTGTLTAVASSGVATFSGLAAPTLAQSGLKLTFTDGSLTSVADGTSITVTATTANKLVMKTEPSSSVTAGAAFGTQPVVYVEDTYGNVVTSDGSTVTATVGTGTGPLTGTLTAVASSGAATFIGLAAPTLAQTGLKLTFTDGSLVSAVDATSITVNPGAASKLVITSTAVTVTAGVASSSITVQRQDQYGNPNTTDTARTVTLSSTSTGTKTFTPASPLTISTGSSSASFTYTDTQAGTPTITAASTSPTTITSATQVETVNPTTANKLVMKTEPSTPVTAGGVFGTPPAVYIEDQYNNVLTGDNSSTVTAAVQTGTGSLTGTLTVTASAGVATFGALAAPTLAQAGLKLQFTDTGDSLSALNDATSITVIPGAVDHFAITAISSPQTAGTAITGITITAQDVNNNTATNFTGTGNSVTYSGTAGITGTSATFTSGVLSGVSVTPTVAGSSLTFIVTGPVGSGSKTGTTTITTINPGAIASYTVSAAAATREAAFNVTVTALDAHGNTVTTDSSTVVTNTASSANVLFDGAGDGSFNDNTVVLTNGVTTISAKDNYFETVTITATDANSKTGNASVTVNALSGDYRSRVTGQTWATANTWQTTSDGSTWTTASSAPTSATTGQISVLNGHTVTVGTSVTAQNLNIASGGTVAINSSQTLTVNNGVANGVINNGTSGGALSVSGGTLDLNGANGYSGGTTIGSGGTVIISSDGNLGNTSGGITFAGGTLQTTGPNVVTTARTITLSTGGGVLNIGIPLYLSGTISGGTGLTTGGNDLILEPSGSANAIGTMTVNSGRLFIFNANAVGSSDVLHIIGGTLDYNISGGTTPTTTTTFASGTCLANRAGTLTVSTTHVTFPTAGTMIFNQDDAVSSAITVNGTYPTLTGPMTFQLGGINATVGTVTLSGAISGGSYGLTKTYPGMLILGSANTYSGGTTISGGILDAHVAGSLGSGDVNVASGATNQLDASTSMSSTARLLLSGTSPNVNLASGINQTVAGLSFDGGATFQTSGTWGYSGKTHNDTVRFTGSGTLTVSSPIALTVTAAANTKTYDGTTNAAATPTHTGTLASGDTATYTETYSTKDAGTGNKTLTPSVAITNSGNQNVTASYSITLNSISTGTINTKALTAAGNLVFPASKVYDGTTVATASSGAAALQTVENTGTGTTGDGIPYTGNGDSVSLNGTAAYNYNTKDVLTANTITESGLTLTGTGNGNYTLTPPSFSSTITKAGASVTANGDSKTYGQTRSYGAGSAAFSSSGLQNGETIGTVTITASGGTANNAPVGSYNLTPSAATAGTFNANNYSITYNAGTLSVNPAPLTITANAQNKVYGTTQSTPVVGSTAFTPTGLQNGETVGTVTLTYAAGGLTATSAAGSTSTITPSAATGGTFTAGNYNINYAPGTLTVTKAPLTITATGPGKTYGTALSAGASGSNFSHSGEVNSESVTSVTLTPNAAGLSATTAAGAGYTVTPSAATGSGGFLESNYQVTYNAYSGTVNQKALSITTPTVTKVYDGGMSAGAVTVGTLSGFVGTETVTASGTATTYSSQNVGSSYASTVSYTLANGNNGGLAANYSLANSVIANAAITSKPIDVTAVTDTKTADGNNSSTGVPTISPALVGTDTSGFIQTFDTATAGTGKTLTPSGSVNDGNSGKNYNVTFHPINTGTINPAVANAYRITDAASGLPTASVGDQLTITLVDQFGNTETSFSGDKMLSFSGLSTADDGTLPTVTSKTGAAVNEGTSELITFASGVSSAGGILTAYKAETKTLNVTDSGSLSSTSTGGAGVSLTIANVAPVAISNSISRIPNTLVAVPLSSLAISSNHNTIMFTAYSATNATATVKTNSYGILYTNIVNVADRVDFGIMDSAGGIGTNHIYISIAAFLTGQQTAPIVSGNSVTLKYYGIPNLTYITQMSTNLPDWLNIATNKVKPTGVPFYVINTFSGTPPASAFFRLEWAGY